MASMVLQQRGKVHLLNVGMARMRLLLLFLLTFIVFSEHMHNLLPEMMAYCEIHLAQSFEHKQARTHITSARCRVVMRFCILFIHSHMYPKTRKRAQLMLLHMCAHHTRVFLFYFWLEEGMMRCARCDAMHVCVCVCITVFFDSTNFN